jgi:hypothetical protein
MSMHAVSQDDRTIELGDTVNVGNDPSRPLPCGNKIKVPCTGTVVYISGMSCIVNTSLGRQQVTHDDLFRWNPPLTADQRFRIVK